MRKHIILAAIAALTSFTACSNEEEEQIPGAEVNFTINNTVTRAITDADGLTTFKDNDKVYLYSSGLQTDMNNTEFVVSDNGTKLTTTSGTFKFNKTSGAIFYAFYPAADASPNATQASFTVNNDQSGDNAFEGCDLMTASKTVIASQAEAVELSFKHRHALVLVDVSGLSEAVVSSVEINNVVPTATWTYATDEIKISESVSKVNIKMGKNTTANDGKYWAIIPAQTISKTNALLTLTLNDGKVYEYFPSADVVFKSDTRSEFQLVFKGNDVVEVGGTLESQWGNLSENNGEITEYALLPNITANTTFTELQNSAGRKALKNLEWGYLFSASGFTATVNPIDGGFTATVSAVPEGSASWYNRSIYFKCRKDFDLEKTYTLSFYAESDNETTGNIYIYVAAETDNRFYCLKENLSRAQINTTKNSGTTKQSIKITPNKISTSSNGSAETDNSEEKTYYITFNLSSTVLTTYTIKKIELIENE